MARGMGNDQQGHGDPGKVMLVDDDPALRFALQDSFLIAGIEVEACSDATAALKDFDPEHYGAVVSDLRMPRIDGLQLLANLRDQDPDLPVILMTGHGDIGTAVSALHQGAFDFLAKPFATEHLIASVRRALATRALVLENRRLRMLAETLPPDEDFLGNSPAISRLREMVRQIAAVQVDVLIEGETGTGKEMVARHLHRLSPRRARPFVAVDCAALPETGAEEILFGSRNRRGRLADAARGTLFLDEIDSLSPALQGRLSHLIEARELPGPGAGLPLDLRILASTKGDLAQAVQRGAFRGDLYYRLESVRLRVPPLRERREDIELLFSVFLAEAARQFDRPRPIIAPEISSRLQLDDWPGNLRELRNLAMQMVLGLQVSTSAARAPLTDQIDMFEKALLCRTLGELDGDVDAAAAHLSLPRRSLYARLNRHGIKPAGFRRRRR
jgi:two-component system C4-dicarboxylate transport response regulator DctD